MLPQDRIGRKELNFFVLIPAFLYDRIEIEIQQNRSVDGLSFERIFPTCKFVISDFQDDLDYSNSTFFRHFATFSCSISHFLKRCFLVALTPVSVRLKYNYFSEWCCWPKWLWRVSHEWCFNFNKNEPKRESTPPIEIEVVEKRST